MDTQDRYLSQHTDRVGRLGQDSRRGLLRVGDRVQVKDPKGRLHTITLVAGGQFQTNRGIFRHDDVIGKPDGQVVTAEGGRQFQVLRPLRSDYVMSMPRGATIIYPKDTGTIINMGDIFPGAHVFEAGAGSGALSMALLDAVGESGHLISVDRRPDFVDIARANVDLWFGHKHPAWDLRSGDAEEILYSLESDSIDRVVLDMLAPWELLKAIIHVLTPGGVLTCYVATVTQMSRLVEDLRAAQSFTEPLAWETMSREWHVEGLAVRPDHRMVGHTGFLLTTRLLAPGMNPLPEDRRPAKASENLDGMWDHENGWSEETVGLRTSSTKKVRRVRRDLVARAHTWVGDTTLDPEQGKKEDKTDE